MRKGLVALIGRFALVAGLLSAISGPGHGQGTAPIAIDFTLDRPVDGAAAPFFMALRTGHFHDAGLRVTIKPGSSSNDTIARVAAGQSQIGLADINALIRFRDDPDAAPVKAVFVLSNAAPYAIIARKSRGIATVADLPGKTLGVAAGDLTIRLWPAVAARNGVRPDALKQQAIGAAVREPMLVAGQIDAVTGFSFLSAVNLRNRGIPADDLTVLRFSDYGCAAYGAALIVNPQFAADHPEAVRAFVRATLAALNQTLRNPAAAIDKVMPEMKESSRDIELARLRAMIDHDVLTAEVRHNGLGGIDADRFALALDQIGADFKFRSRPTLADIFDDRFLPPAAQRRPATD